MSSVAQTALQLRHLARNAAWVEGSAELVLGSSVYVTAGFMPEDMPRRFPFGLINIATGNPDAEDPNLIEQEFILVLVALVKGDALGENAIVGGPRTAGQGSSKGRGVAELEEVVLANVGKLTGADGAPIIVSHGTTVGTQHVGEDVHLVQRQFVLRALCTRQKSYPAPQRLVATTPGGGVVNLAWSKPSRFDFQTVTVVRKAGSSAPTDETDGTVIQDTDAESASDTPGASPVSYGVFAKYSYTGDTTNDLNYSDAETGTTRAGIAP